MKIEFDRFILKALGSDLTAELHSQISKLTLKYEYHKRREDINFLTRLLIGRAAVYQREREHKELIDQLKYQIKGIPMFIKMNY